MITATRKKAGGIKPEDYNNRNPILTRKQKCRMKLDAAKFWQVLCQDLEESDYELLVDTSIWFREKWGYFAFLRLMDKFSVYRRRHAEQKILEIKAEWKLKTA